ncbi:adenylyltransferase/cytidyltransferase family protein [Haloactinomyces albus]|uniref:FAD synthase n=1 Tax=Haloactinomyces albus TaxID=1352928 RepID=A0AAE4CPX3_9ACTN|nr:adenylyltransferase/cytidyltransferase family protein [Haloactinomyces albus]MDR7303537.1 riboflavin kinase/FMN adenylyltransferase [Haloactinomyces albus]
MSTPTAEAAAPLWHGTGEVPAGFGPCVATLGVFDGLHRGHIRLIDQAVRAGDARGLPAVLVTFDPHPARVLGLARDTAQLSTVERRAELARRHGVDAICVLPFTTEFAKLGPAEFVEHVLVTGVGAQAVVVGANFTFGHRAAGTVDTLRELGQRHSFTTHSIDLVHQAETRCSSSTVRECLRRGDIHGATRVLGRPHHVDGTLRPTGRGTTELVSAPGTAVPAPGRYLGRLPGTGPVALRVTDDGRIHVESTSVQPGPGSVAFTARKAAHSSEL